jgi:hypothetical protein
MKTIQKVFLMRRTLKLNRNLLVLVNLYILKNYHLGLNMIEKKKEIKVGIVDTNKNIVHYEIIKCEGLNFSDEQYISQVKIEKIKEICK